MTRRKVGKGMHAEKCPVCEGVGYIIEGCTSSGFIPAKECRACKGARWIVVPDNAAELAELSELREQEKTRERQELEREAKWQIGEIAPDNYIDISPAPRDDK